MFGLMGKNLLMHRHKLSSAVTWGPWVKSRLQSAPPKPRSHRQKPKVNTIIRLVFDMYDLFCHL